MFEKNLKASLARILPHRDALPAGILSFLLFFHTLSAISLTARAAASASWSVLKNPKLKRTAPCSSVPRALCIRGAQWAPALVAIL